MNTRLLTRLLSIGLIASAGCSDHKTETRKAQNDAESKARAAFARKEMDAVPKTFQTPDYFKKNEPAKEMTAAKPQPNTKP